ncbi:MAG: hypothetical protein ACE5R6_14530 [Candidatus Heimdallarchaeota archaeon]
MKIAADLQQRLETRIDFDFTISFLTDLYERQQQKLDLFQEFCKEISNVSFNKAYEILREERMVDDRQYE